MAFTDHKISAFTHKISDLADQPNLPPDELKARFDACPEELRVAHNALCDEANRLDERVGGIVAGTFGDTITEDMLSDELRETIEGAAAGGAVTEQIEAETTAREQADAALDSRVTSLESSSSKAMQMYAQMYIGDGTASKDIFIGFAPRAVIIMQHSYRNDVSDKVTGGIAVADRPLSKGWYGAIGAEVTSTGFTVHENASEDIALNTADVVYWYVALG